MATIANRTAQGKYGREKDVEVHVLSRGIKPGVCFATPHDYTSVTFEIDGKIIKLSRAEVLDLLKL